MDSTSESADFRPSKERGILKLDTRPRLSIDSRKELTPQASWERGPGSPQPSVDRLSVTWADPEDSMASSGVNLYHLPAETVANNETKFSAVQDGSEDEDYSASLSAVLRQRRASVRRSRKGRARRPSSPFLPDDKSSRRRSSVFTTSSGDTAISIEEGQSTLVTQEQIFENIHLHKEVLGSVKQQLFDMRRKLKIVQQAKTYIKRHEGQLQERLAQSKSTRDIYARFNILMTTKLHQLKREAANMSNLVIPWELRIKEIESHFGSVVASYFTFLRWLFWVNLVIGFILLVFVIVPECLTANPKEDGGRKTFSDEERQNATNLLTLWEFEGVLKLSPIFYGFYSNIERPQYRMPLAYFLTGLAVYIYSFVATLRKMAENSRMSKLSEKEDESVFSWKLFTGWDFMIGNAETAHNRIASVILSFKEALLEEAEKKKDMRNWRVISLRAFVNICVIILLAVSAFAVVKVVSRSDDNTTPHNWWRENETTIVVTIISITFPVFFELLGFLEHYHPRKQLRLQLARIMLLNLLNLYSLIFALFSKIEGMSGELDSLKPRINDTIDTNWTIPNSTFNTNETVIENVVIDCNEIELLEECSSCSLLLNLSIKTILLSTDSAIHSSTWAVQKPTGTSQMKDINVSTATTNSGAENLIIFVDDSISSTEKHIDASIRNELFRLRRLGMELNRINDTNETSSESYEDYNDYSYENIFKVTDTITETSSSSLDTSTDFSTSYSSNTIDDTFTNNEDGNKSSSFSETITVMDTTYEYEVTTESPTLKDTMVTTVSFNESIEIYNTLESEHSDISSTTEIFTTNFRDPSNNCPFIIINCTIICGKENITQIYIISNRKLISKKCYINKILPLNYYKENLMQNLTQNDNETNITTVIKDVAYLNEHNIIMYNLTNGTKKKLLKLCWETMFGQELVKLTMMDLVFVLLGTLFTDFFRALFVRYMNRCWCWDLEKRFPEYGDFKIAENILHLINNQGMVWMGMFFSPGLVVLNVFKLVIMMYLRSWTVMTCNVPHEVVFRVSKSNNFYLGLLLTMLFLCVLPVGYSIVWVKPSWHCGPFSEYQRIYYIITTKIYKILPTSLNFAIQYIASPAIVIPLLVLLILIIYYLTSLTNSLREANNDLKIQLRRERTEERRKVFQIADTRRRVGSAEMDNTPFARWKKALPSLPLGKSIDSDDRKTTTGDEEAASNNVTKKKVGIFAKIVAMAQDRKSHITPDADTKVSMSPNFDDETDTDFHESLPKELLEIKDIKIVKDTEICKKKTNVEFKPDHKFEENIVSSDKTLIKTRNFDKDVTRSHKIITYDGRKQLTKRSPTNFASDGMSEQIDAADVIEKDDAATKKLSRKQTSESSTQSKQSDSVGSVIPVITISTTESDDEVLQARKIKGKDKYKTEKGIPGKSETTEKQHKKAKVELKSLRRQSSVDSINDEKFTKDKKPEEGHKYQYSL